MKKIFITSAIVISTAAAHAQAHANDNLFYNNGANVTVQTGALVTIQGDMTTNQAGVTAITHLDNNGFIWLQGNAYGDNAFKQTGTGTLRLQNKTALYTAPYETEAYQVIQGGYKVNGGQAAIAATDDGSFYTLELDNQAGLVFIKSNTDVRNAVDFKPASVTADGNTIAPNGTINRLLTYDPGTGTTAAAAPANGASYTAVFGMMNNVAGMGNFKNVSTNLTTNTTALDNAYVQGKLRRALDATSGGSYGFPLGLEPSTSSTAARGIQYTNLDFTASSYDVLTGYFQQGSDNTVAAPGTVCSIVGGFVYYGTSNHGEWIFTPQTASTELYNLTIYPQDYGTTASSRYFITKDNTVPVPGTQSCAASPVGLSVTGIQSFSEFGFAGGTMILPVKLVSFTGIMNNCTATLTWRSAEEPNFSKYQLEYSADGVKFNTVADINSKGDNSTYTAAHAPRQGQAFYRLKMIDKDGRAEYSSIVALTGNCNKAQVSIYPNPATSFIMINGAAEKSVIGLYDIAGKLLIRQTATGSAVDKLNIDKLASGNYIIKITDAGGVIINSKITKQ